MVARVLVALGLVVIAGGFIFFAANVIWLWLGIGEFFKIYGPKAEKEQLLKEDSTNESSKVAK